jgi:hypothetical protein
MTTSRHHGLLGISGLAVAVVVMSLGGWTNVETLSLIRGR